MIRFTFEQTIIRPKVYTVRDTRDASFVNLHTPSACSYAKRGSQVRYHFSSFRSRNGEFEVGVFLPISEQQWELCQETIIHASHVGYGFETRTAIKSPLRGFHTANEGFPGIEIVRIIFLDFSQCFMVRIYHLAVQSVKVFF
jgi:hypothetical protein